MEGAWAAAGAEKRARRGGVEGPGSQGARVGFLCVWSYGPRGGGGAPAALGTLCGPPHPVWSQAVPART